jgi:hypothetical protein
MLSRMRLWVALVVSTTVACGGKSTDSTGAVEPGDPTPAPTHTPDNPTATPLTPAPPPTATTAPPIGTTRPSTPADAGVLVPPDDDASSPPLWTPNTEETIVFEPTLVDATRFPTVCGIMNPPFMNGDLYSLDIVDQRGATPYAALTLSFSSPAPAVGTPLMLTVQPFTPQADGIGQLDGSTMWYAAQNAQGSQGSGINFQYSQGAHPSEIDTGAFDAVTITILAMPTANGQPLTVRIQMHFVDGKSLDETFSNALASSWGGCPAG